MRTASGTLGTLMQTEALHLARLWIITRIDGTVLYLTDHDKDIPEGGHVFKHSGFTSSAVLSASDQTVIQGMTMTVLFATDQFTIEDCNGHRYDGSASLLRIVDWTNPDAGSMTIFGGTITRSEVKGEKQVALEVDGLMSANRQINVESYGSMCRANLGDSRCKFDINSLKATFTVATVVNALEFTTVELNQADFYWNLGVLQITSGPNEGMSVEVRNSTSVTKDIEVYVPLPFDLQPGDTGNIWPGCDKSFVMCHDRYNNVVNIRAEPQFQNPASGVTVSVDGTGSGTGSGSTASVPLLNFLATIICTELNAQCLIETKLYAADREYGRKLALEYPWTYAGYMLWATPVVKLMRKSYRFTQFVAWVGMPIIREMAGEHSRYGSVGLKLGRAFSTMLAWLVLRD